MSDELPAGSVSLESPPTNVPPAEPEPEGVVEVQGQKLVPVSALVAERDRVRNAEREKLAREYEPIQQRADQADRLAADLAAVQPHLDYLRQHPELLNPPQTPNIPSVSDEEAEKYARRYELYTATGLDLSRAKQIIADNRAEMSKVAKEAAQEAVQPYAQTTAVQQSRQNFVWAASQRDANGQSLVDPRVLAAEWAKLPAELTAQGQVAEWILRAAIGTAQVTGRQRPQATNQDPTFTEVPGGGPQQAYQMGTLERRMARVAGMSEKDFTERAKTYQPDRVNVLE